MTNNMTATEEKGRMTEGSGAAVRPCVKRKATRRISSETRIWHSSAKDDD